MKGVKEDQQIDGIAGFWVKEYIYFFMLDMDITNVDVFSKDGVLSFHTFTLTVNHGLFQDKKIMEYKPRSSNVGKSWEGDVPARSRIRWRLASHSNR